jgi:hypothetical protein
MKKFIFLFSIAALITMFQNCQKAAYTSSSEDSLSKAQSVLTPVQSDDPEDASGQIVQPSQDEPSPDEPSQDVVTHGNGQDNGNRIENGTENDGVSGDYVCILDGPGKSIKLGLADKLQGQNAIPGVLCMTAHACLDIASQAFGVKGPELRGYCKSAHGNPNVTHISDTDLQVKVNDLSTQ